MNSIIDSIFMEKKVIGEGGNVHPLHSGIDRKEGEFLYWLIKENPLLAKSLEIGCAYGISSLYITEALRGRYGASHTIIDPFQRSRWDGVGLSNLKRSGIDFHRWIESKSEFALPRILEHEENTYDFIFIDGWHTFDHTMLDIFYSTRLLKVGGILAIDDANMPAVKKAIDFTRTYPCYELTRPVSFKHAPGEITSLKDLRSAAKGIAKKIIPAFIRSKGGNQPSMVALVKKTSDERSWDWHCDDF